MKSEGEDPMNSCLGAVRTWVWNRFITGQWGSPHIPFPLQVEQIIMGIPPGK
jgi:hypothetical protein